MSITSEARLHPPLTELWSIGWGAKSPGPVYNMISTVNFVFILCERVPYTRNFMKVEKNFFQMKFFNFGLSPSRINKNCQVKVKYSRRLLEMQSVDQKIMKTSEYLVQRLQ